MPLVNNININESYLFFEDKKLLGFPQEAIKYIQKQAQEILELKNEKKELEKKAYYDELTGLLNRHGLKEEMNKLFTNNEEISLITIDIKDLGKINNLFGIIRGDEAIKNTAEMLKHFFRWNRQKTKTEKRHNTNNINTYTKDIIVRFGGDEFIVIINRLDEKILLKRIEKIKKWIDKKNKETEYEYNLHIKYNNSCKINEYQLANQLNHFHLKSSKLKEV